MKNKFNFLHNSLLEPHSSDTPHWLKTAKMIFYPLVFAGVFLLAFFFQTVLSGEHEVGTITSIGESIKNFSFFNSLGLTSDKPLKGEDRDRINILLLGMGGKGHEGPYLTDTMILASLKPSTKELAMVSIPRDLSVPIPHYGWRKINSINSFGELNEPGQGAAFTSEVVGDLVDQPIDYYLRLDFSGFANLINELGGVEVYVDRSFTDNEFPNENYGYNPVTFKEGMTKMDGDTALNYARSRHGNNQEGSDFARSQRQQKIIKAVKEKILTSQTLMNPRKLGALYSTYKDNVSTNMEAWEILRFAKLGKDIDSKNISTQVIDNSPGGFLYSTMINGAFLLMPKDESFDDIKKMIADINTPQETIAQEVKPTIIIENSTTIEGLAWRVSVDLKKGGYKVLRIGNATDRNLEKTLIYDLTDGQKPQALENLQQKLEAQTTKDLPAWLQAQKDSILASGAEFIVVLGQSASLITKS